MDVSVRELRNHIGRVIAAVESGEVVLADLVEISELAGRLDVRSGSGDFDVGLTTDDMLR